MKRPDEGILKRALKKRYVRGDATRLEEFIKIGLDLPIFNLKEDGHKILEFKPDSTVAAEDLGWNEPLYDEYVMYYEGLFQLTEKSDLRAKLLTGALQYDGGYLIKAKCWAMVLNPFHPFLLKLTNYPQSIEGLHEGFLREEATQRSKKENITLDLDSIKFMTFMCVYEGEPHVYLYQGWVVDGHGGSDPSREFTNLVLATEGTETFWGDRIKGLSEHALQSAQLASDLWVYSKWGEKHPVEVSPQKPKRNNTLSKKRPWRAAAGPHILFLDRMPTTQPQNTGGTHASPKPHRRRGHWRTLTHPKYRHHPQYQQPIYVKPSFVGPPEVGYEGNIYRLIKPLI